MIVSPKLYPYAEKYSEPFQISKVEFFAKIINDSWPLLTRHLTTNYGYKAYL